MGKNSDRMPVLFVGHGNPMNAIEENSFTKRLFELGTRLPRPRAILCISAHWMTEGIWITEMECPKTIHDFYGFPQKLFDVQYPAPGAPEIAKAIRAKIHQPKINGDSDMWGFDHGVWSILKHMYPKADIPVMGMSIYMQQSAAFHLELGEKLKSFRDEGILIVGSGNIVHNLKYLDWSRDALAHDWAIEFDSWVKEKLEQRDFEALANQYLDSEAGRLSVPSPDHYYPLFPVLGATDAEDKLNFEFEEIHNGSISMRTLSFGL